MRMAKDTVVKEQLEDILDGRMLTIRDVSLMLSVHPSSVRRWVDQGLLRCYRIGLRGDRRFKAEDIHSFVDSWNK